MRLFCVNVCLELFPAIIYDISSSIWNFYSDKECHHPRDRRLSTPWVSDEGPRWNPLHFTTLTRPSLCREVWEILQSCCTQKSFRNLIKSNRNQIVFTIFRLIWNQTDVRLVPNQSANGKYNLISVWFN